MARDWGETLQGVGAWWSGKGPAYETAKVRNQQNEQYLQQQRQEQNAKMQKQRDEALVKDFQTAYVLGKQGRFERAAEFLGERAGYINQLGGDPKHTIGIMDMFQTPERQGEAMQELEAFLARGDMLPGGEKGLASAKTYQYDNGTINWALPNGETRVTDPSGKEVTGEDRVKVLADARREQIAFAGNKAAATAAGTLGVEGEMKPQIEGDIAKSKATGKATGERIQLAIDDGLDASKGMAVIKRGLSLLKSVETGGIDNAMLQAKRLFGVESADEAELSSSLGKAVLSQLRATFGAQFTEREGQRLAEIEAGFGKSTAGNIRLLKKTEELITRTAERGIKAAVDSGDYRSAADIQDLLDFQLDDEGLSAQFIQKPTNAPKFLGFEE